MENENAGVETVENTTNDAEMVSVDELKKAQAKIVELKKQIKQTNVSKEETKEENVVEEKEEEPAQNNNEVAELKSKLEELQAQLNQNNTNNMDLHWQAVETDATSFTEEDLENMSQSEYNKAMSLIESGKASFI